MLQVVKDIISSVSIDPSSHSESSSSDSDSSDNELASAMEGSLNLNNNSNTKNEGSYKEVPGSWKAGEAQSKKIYEPLKLPKQPVDEYLNGFLLSLVHRFYQHKTFDEYTKVRDYKFGKSKLELMSKFRDNSSNLKEFLVNGVIDVPMENLLTLVMELGNRTKWDETYLEHMMLRFDEATKTEYVYSVSKYPFPLTKRTYLLTRTCYSYGDDCIVVLSATTTKVQMPKKLKWSTQVDQFESLLVVKNCEPEMVDGVKKVTKSYMLATYFENPKVMLPNSYLNFLIGQLVPGILSKMVIASKKFNFEESVKYVQSMKMIPIPKNV